MDSVLGSVWGYFGVRLRLWLATVEASQRQLEDQRKRRWPRWLGGGSEDIAGTRTAGDPDA